MAKSLLNRIKEKIAKVGSASLTTAAKQWFRDKIGKLFGGKPTPITGGPKPPQKIVSRPIIGKLYFYVYDPKYKDQPNILPYYDTYPLTIPIEYYSDGFLGLNLHYIYPKDRAILLDKLSETLTNHKYDDTTKMRINYNLLRSSSKYFEHTPCLKRYLYNHVRSQFIEIPASEWDIAIMLPAEKFVRETKTAVWALSRGKY